MTVQRSAIGTAGEHQNTTGHAERRVLPLRPHLAGTGFVVKQFAVGFDLVEARVFEGPLGRNIVKIGVSADRRHTETGGNLHQVGGQRT